MDQTRPQGHPSGPSPSPGYETSDTNIRAVVGFGIGLVVLLIVVSSVLLGIMGSVAAHRPPARAEAAPVDVTEDMKRLRADESTVLDHSGPIKDEPGYARIPVEKAMDLLIKKGVPFGKGRKTEVQVNTRVKQ